MKIRTSAQLFVLAVLLAACNGGGDGGTGNGDGGDGAAGDETQQAEGTACADVDLAQAPAEPTTIRIGHGAAAEEPFWLMTADEEVTEHQGTWYEMELAPFRGTEERLQAYQAGELDAVVISPQAQIQGTAREALDLYAIGTIMREAEPEAFSTSFIALEDSGIQSPEDMAGKRVAVVDIGSQLDFLARLAAQQAGLDPDTDLEYIVFPFPAQEEALRGGQIDVAGLPEPFYTLAQSQGGVVDVFNAADLTDFAYDLLTLSFDRQFVTDNLEAVCAWAADYESSMQAYRENQEEARRAILENTDLIPLPPEAYLQTGDYARPEGGVVDTDGMQQMMDLMIEQGILTEDDRVDPETLVLPGVSLGH